MAKNTPILEQETSLAAETIVGHSVKIEGDLVSDGDIKVDGVVSGKVKTTQNLFIGPTAKIEADVQAGSATIAGQVNGNIRADGLLVILQTGQVTGDIDCKQLAIEEGAYFAGSCKMNDRAGGKAASKPLEDEEEE